MSQSNLEAIYSQIDSLPSLPAIVIDVLEITGNPESSANDLMNAILPDQSMCAAILKIANSAFFGLPRQVGTVEKAIMVLGFDEVKNIVLGKAVFNSFKELNGNNKETIEDFWEHSFTCGLAAKIIAEHVDLSPSQLFIAGLIHDIGKLAMLMTFPNIYQHLLFTTDESWVNNCEKESELFFISHDKVAERILNRWLFPENLVVGVGYHHRPENLEEGHIFASTVRIADALAHLVSAEAFPDGDLRILLEKCCPDLFDIFDEYQYSCQGEDIALWLEQLITSKDQNGAILSIFST